MVIFVHVGTIELNVPKELKKRSHVSQQVKCRTYFTRTWQNCAVLRVREIYINVQTLLYSQIELERMYIDMHT